MTKDKTSAKAGTTAEPSASEAATPAASAKTTKKTTKKAAAKKTAKKTVKKTATTKKTTKKKTTKKVASKAQPTASATSVEPAAAESPKSTAKTVKTTKKKTSKKTTKKKTTKKDAAKSAPIQETATAAATTTAEAPSKTTKKKTGKKTTRKTTPKAPATTPVEDKAQSNEEVKEEIKAKAKVAAKVEAEKPLAAMSIEERLAFKQQQQQQGAAPRESTTAPSSKRPQRTPRATTPAATDTLAAPQTETPPSSAPIHESASITLKGEKISGGLLALEQNAVRQNGKATAPAASVSPTPVKAEPQSEQPTPVAPASAQEEQTAEETEEEKKLSRSARRRRNKKKKREQDTGATEAEASTNGESETKPKQSFEPITATTILAETSKKTTPTRKNTERNMLMNVVDHGEIRVAIAGKNGLEEIYIEKSGGEFVHGNIFKGVVENVEPNLQAAFVNIGAEKNGFLHVRDVIYPFGGYEDVLGKPNRQKPVSKRPPINHMLKKGQEILVQITREQVATKGPSLTTYISLPGRYLVLMPAVKKRGVSKKITNKAERDELRKALEQLDPPNDMGYIIRTAGMGKGKDELQRDLDYLTMLWEAITNHTKNVKGPMPIYQESDLVLRAIRDYFTDSIDTLFIDSEEEFKRAQEFLKLTMPEDLKRAKYYDDSEPLFSHYAVEEEISALFSKSVRLKSGGELIIEQTEAMVTIDVNTGKFLKGKSSHDLILKINKEAAAEIAKQLRLRDMGGLVMIDFIDMESEEHRRTIENIFRSAMQADRAKTTILPISSLGIMEMTRQRMRQSLNLSHFDTCKYCGGTGVVKNLATLETEFIRALKKELKVGIDCKIKMNPTTAIALANKSREALTSLEREYDNSIIIISDPTLTPDKFNIDQ